MDTTPVLVVGGGPVGLALSIDLAWRGIDHVLVDRDPPEARARHPRMDQVGVRSMEHVRRLGLTADIEAAGFPRTLRRDVVFTTALLGHELDREPFEADATRPAPPFSPARHELCPQNFLDPALQRAAARSPHADIRHRTTLLDLHDDGAAVRCRLRDAASGRDTTLAARYVVGCDGGGSTVAAHLGVAAETATTLARSTNIFLHSPALRARIAGPTGYRYLLVGPAGVWASMVNMDGRDVWRLQVLGAADRPDWTEAEARAAIGRALGGEVPYTLGPIVPWIRRELVMDRFAAGRCFLAGDAAHQFSPTGGYGMNTGLGEAFDLAWKLAATLDGWGGDGLLASYAAERRPVALRNARQATLNFSRMREPRRYPDLAADSPEGAAERARAGAEIRAHMHEEWDSWGIHLGYGYAGSPLVLDEPDPGTHAPPYDYVQSAAPGARAPHAWLAPGHSTLDLFGRGFVLLRFDADAEVRPLLEAAAHARMPLRVHDIADPDIARLYGRKLVLVRPDGHVAMRAEALPPDPAVVVARVRGAT